jgi:replicative superfamily II helicase
LSELKIAAVVLQGQKVVYIAPTLALVGQVSRNLKALLPEVRVEAGGYEDQLFADIDEVLSGEAWVMTPERCLLMMGLYPERFAGVGLIVFDECHTLHCEVDRNERRSLNAMVCLLKLLEGLT